ncbi:MAG: contractile injection system tape measure protein [Chromatiales bacterium]
MLTGPEMRTRHLVDTAIFDIGFSDEETAFQAQSGLESLIKQQLLSVVDEVFERRSHSGFVMRIPSLEVDLGKVSYQDYREELPRRLRERLTTLLADLHLPNTLVSATSAGLIDESRAEYLQLEHFLRYGSLPWYENPEDEIDWSGILLRVLRDQGQRLKNFLEGTPHRRQVTTRLVSQFEVTSIVRLLGLLAPAHVGSVSQLMEQVILAWHEQPVIINSLGLDQDAVGRQLWCFLLEVVLGQDGHQYSAQELVVKALQRMLLEKYQLNRKVLESFIAQSSRSQAGHPAAVNELLQQLMQQWQQPPGPAQGIELRQASNGQPLAEVEKPQTERQVSAGLRAVLLNAIESGDFEAIDAVWDEVMAQQAALLQRLLRHYGQDARIRKRLVHGLSEARLRALLEMIEPVEHEFVTTVLDRHELFVPQQIKDDRGGERTRRQLWEFTFGYLLVERGSRFNKKAYLASLLRQMASSANCYFVELLDALLVNLDAQVGKRRLSGQMRQLLMELRDEQGEATPENEHAGASVVTGYLLYERLTQALIHGIDTVAGDETALIDSLAELRQTHPWLLLRLVHELRFSPGSPLASLSPDLPASLIGRLVHALLELMNPDGSELLAALQHYAERAGDQRQYYRRLLASLVAGELLDFEALIGETPMPADSASTSHDRAASPPIAVSEPAADHPGLDLALLVERIGRYLQGEVKFSARTRSALIRDISRQLQYRSRPVLDRLLSAAVIPQQLDRLVALLPERLLAEIVYILAGQAAQLLLEMAELMTLSCHAMHKDGMARNLTGIKWSTVFSYLDKSGGLFNERGFVRHAVEHLTVRLQHDDSAQLGHLLVQGLAANRLPSTRELCLRIVDGIDRPALPAAEADQADATTEPGPVQEPASQTEVYVNNAGLVLAAPYLPRLFEMLGLVEKSAFNSTEAALRAVHLLQCLVDENTACPEYRLFLNKLLCGIEPAAAVPRQIEPVEQELDILQGLLQGMIDNWKALGNTSVAGLREAFLQRQGRLQLLDDAWHLRVETKAYDMLLDQLPWSFSIIKHPWMDRVIHVEWR